MEKIFKNFDAYLNKLPKTQLIMLYVAVVLLGSFTLYHTLPDLMSENDSLKDKIVNLKSKIRSNSIPKLKGMLKSRERVVLKENSNYTKLKEHSTLLLSKLHTLKFIVFDEKRWIATLEDVLKSSIKYNIKVNYVKNMDFKDKVKNLSIIKGKKSVEIEAVGKYKNLVKYIQYIESLPILAEFDDIKFTLEGDSVKASLLFNAYGVEI